MTTGRVAFQTSDKLGKYKSKEAEETFNRLRDYGQKSHDTGDAFYQVTTSRINWSNFRFTER